MCCFWSPTFFISRLIWLFCHPPVTKVADSSSSSCAEQVIYLFCGISFHSSFLIIFFVARIFVLCLKRIWCGSVTFVEDPFLSCSSILSHIVELRYNILSFVRLEYIHWTSILVSFSILWRIEKPEPNPNALATAHQWQLLTHDPDLLYK